MEILSTSGRRLRYVHGELAAALVAHGHAEVAARNARIKQVQLIATPNQMTPRLGPAKATLPLNTKFTRCVKTDSGHVYYEHHPRALEPSSDDATVVTKG